MYCTGRVMFAAYLELRLLLLLLPVSVACSSSSGSCCASCKGYLCCKHVAGQRLWPQLWLWPQLLLLLLPALTLIQAAWLPPLQPAQ